MNLQAIRIEAAFDKYTEGQMTRDTFISRLRAAGVDGQLLEDNLKVADKIRTQFMGPETASA